MSLASPVLADFTDPGPVGLAAMSNYQLLPYLWDGNWHKYASSYDRTEQNVDRNNFLYTVGSEKVMMEAEGPGCIYRLWITSLATGKYTLRIYFDNESTPRVSTIWNNITNGTYSPFLSPFTGYTSGGYYCYLPMPFKHHVRVTISDPGSDWFYYNVGYITYTDKNVVTTYTGSESRTAAANTWNSTGNPNTTSEIQTIASSSSLAPGASATIVDRAGPAMINSISVRMTQIVPNNSVSESILDNVRIRAYWDNETTPSVDAPIGEFFGTGIGEHTVNALPFKMDTSASGWYRNYFPMPFGSRARIVIVNESGYTVNPIEWDVRVGSMPDAATKLSQGKVGYFRAFANKEYTTTRDRDYLILQTTGRGCFVGCVVTPRGLGSSYHFLEGDERIYVDGALSPSIYGTGTEDFFNCGWYYKNGEVTVQTHGCPAKVTSPTYQTSSYRLFLSDKLPFYSSLKVGLEHDAINDADGNYSSVAFYYSVAAPALKLSDELDVGQQASEAAHSYQITNQIYNGMDWFAYEGDDPATYSDDGRKFTSQSQFRMTIDPANKGVKLRRRANYGMLNQTAQVYVDGSLVGTWAEYGNNSAWRDCDFEIPQSFTAGKSSILIRIASSAWTDYRYRTYSYVSADNTAPSGVRSIAAVAVPNQVQLSWNNPPDPDLKGVMVRYKTSTYPTSMTDGAILLDTRAWPDMRSSYNHSGLINGRTYYYSIFAYDGTGSYSVTNATGTPHLLTCSSLKQMPEYTWLSMSNKIVTAVFTSDGAVYVAEPDRTSGIRLLHPGTGLKAGDVVEVYGCLGTRTSSNYPCERQIASAEISKLLNGPAPRPLAMQCSAVGGAAVPPFMPGVEGGVGTNNMGMLVKICGVITSKISTYIYVDDCSGVTDLLGTPGVLVRCPSSSIPYNVGDFVSATGIVEGSIPSGFTNNRRYIHTRDWNDLRKF